MVVVGGVDTTVTVVQLKDDTKRATAAVRSIPYLCFRFGGLLEAGGGGRARRRHETVQLRVRGRQHRRCRCPEAVAAGSGSTRGRRGWGIYSGRCPGRRICCRVPFRL